MSDRFRDGLSVERFLEQQQRLADGLSVETIYGEKEPSAVVFDGCTFTRAYQDNDGPPNIYIGAHTRIDSGVKVEGGLGVRIGAYVHIASGAHINIGGGELVVGDYAAIASGVRIVTGGNAPDAESCSAVAPIEMQVLHRRKVTLEKNSCLYVGCLVMPGVTIGEGARVMPGSLVTKNIPPFEVWRGSPARFHRNRTDTDYVGKAWEGIHLCEDCGGHSRTHPCPFCAETARIQGIIDAAVVTTAFDRLSKTDLSWVKPEAER